MQHVGRPGVAPQVLRSKEAQQSRRAMQSFMSLGRARRSQTSVPNIGMNPNHDLLVQAVAGLTGGRCAFCEAIDALTTYRFRPVGNALPLADREDAHLFYVWLADAWQNLFPICLGCRPSEPVFPVDGARGKLPSPQQIAKYVSKGDGVWSSFPPIEKNQLIDPTRETAFDAHFRPKLDGRLVALSPRAAITLEAFSLNREQRENQRAMRYSANLDLLRALLVGARRIKGVNASSSMWNELFDFGNMEFGGTWFLLLKRLAMRIDSPMGSNVRASRKQLKQFFQQLVGPGAGDSFDRALSEVSREDVGLRSVSAGSTKTQGLRAQLQQIEVVNFKAIEKIELRLPPARVDEESGGYQAPSLIILGENATGKSSILEAIALTLTSEEVRRSLEIAWSSVPLDPSQMGLEEVRKPGGAQVRLSFDSGQTASVTISDGEATARSEFGSERVAVFAYGAFRRFADDGAELRSSRHIRNLFDATTLANPEPWLRSLAPETFNMVVRTLRDLLSIEGEFDVVQRFGRSKQLRMVTAITDPNGVIRFSRAPLQAVSSGYRSMLGMLCDILRGILDAHASEGFSSFETARGVILIDEIEAHLHPRWKVQVMSSLRKALPGMTFIVTTHDPLCLRGMGNDEIVVLQRVSSSDTGVTSSLPIMVERMTNLPDAANLRLEQLLTSDFFQLFSTNDAAADRKMAQIGDLVRKRSEGEALDEEENHVLNLFERDIAKALPVGSTEVHRLVQEAVAEYLKKRRDASSDTLARLSERAKAEILMALEMI
jgi:hypothetical protein